MAPDSLTALTIVLMALATYATRAAGLWLASRLKMSARVKVWLNHIPGAILVSIVAPTVLAGGFADALAAVAVLIVAVRTGSLPVAMVTGVGAVVLLRGLL